MFAYSGVNARLHNRALCGPREGWFQAGAAVEHIKGSSSSTERETEGKRD